MFDVYIEKVIVENIEIVDEFENIIDMMKN
jgi:hypothetical protein